MKENLDESQYPIIAEIKEYIESLNVYFEITNNENRYYNSFSIVGKSYDIIDGYKEVIICLIGRIDIDNNKILINCKIPSKNTLGMIKFLKDLNKVKYKIDHHSSDYDILLIGILHCNTNIVMPIIQKLYDLII